MTALVIDYAAEARKRKVAALIEALTQYAKAQGPYDAVALEMLARQLTPESWAILESLAKCKRPASSTTRQLVLDELEDRARALRFVKYAVEEE